MGGGKGRRSNKQTQKNEETMNSTDPPARRPRGAASGSPPSPSCYARITKGECQLLPFSAPYSPTWLSDQCRDHRPVSTLGLAAQSSFPGGPWGSGRETPGRGGGVCQRRGDTDMYPIGGGGPTATGGGGKIGRAGSGKTGGK
eukprot:Hpha_TRINITY_DN16811_c3_g11::TRINITY_DN16811_c3_g11_i1::g.151302::m.151302